MSQYQVDTRRYRWAGVVCLVVGSLAVLVQYLITPISGTLEVPELLDKVEANHTAMGVAVALDVLILLVIPAVLFAGRVAGSRTSALAGVATALCFVPMLGSVILLAFDALAYEASVQPDRAAAEDLVSAFQSNPFVGGVTAVYLLTHVAGFFLLAVALRRRQAVPWWAYVALGAWPVIEMAGYALNLKAVSAVAYAMLVVGYSACAATLLRGGGEESHAAARQQVLSAS